MQAPPAAFPVRRFWRGRGVSRSGSSEWLGGVPRTHTEAAQQLQAKGPRYCASGRGPSGTRRITPFVAQAGRPGRWRRIGRWRLQAGRPGKTRGTVKAPPTAGQAQTIAPNPRNRAVTVQVPDTGYVGDIPALPTGAGWLSLAVVLARCARAVVGWALADPLRAELGTQALVMASGQRQPAAGVSRPTDRGRQ